MTADSPSSETEPVDTVDREEADVLLADPDDYHQSQRLKQIHKTRERVHDVIYDLNRWTSEKEHAKQKRKLAQAVASYITELEPLINQSKSEIDLPDKFPFDSVHEYANTLGRYQSEDGGSSIAAYGTSVFVFRRCNSFLEEVKPLISEDDNEPGYLDL